MRLVSRLSFVLLLVCSFFAALPAQAVSTTIVISQVYGGAGCGTVGCSTYKNDYIELFNRSAAPVNVNGWSVQYAAATGTSWQVTALGNITIPAGGYLLVAEGAGANGVNNLPTPDVTGTINMSATAAKVALVNTTVALSGSGCPLAASVVDFVGYGATANCNEGGANTPAPSTTNAVFRAMGGCTDTDSNSSDFSAAAATPRNSASTLNVCGGPPPMPTLNIGNVSLAEGDPPGTTTFTFAVTLTAPAGPGGVTFDIATADGTATVADNDYVTNSLTGQNIPMGSTGPYNFSVTVNRDTMAEANETFSVNVSNIVGATPGPSLPGQGTISNDDVSITPIHDIQGPGASSPIVGASVTTRGIVTGVRSNGFFIQEPDAMVDADPATSEGILVFGSPVPAAAVVGALVQVTGTVTEFVPTQDPLQPPLTELSGATVVQLSTGNPLPAAIPLTATFPDPAGPHDQLERLEGMRVSAASLTVSGPTLGTVSEANATATSSGVFYGVITGVARPFREAGIPAPDPAPSGGGTIPPIPRFDSNPERIRVDSDGLVGGPLIDVGTGAVVTGLVGPLDYTFRTYTILPDPGATIGVAGGPVALMAAQATAQELTVASYNMERFFDTVNDPSVSDVALTAAAFDMRLNKASLAIRNFLKMPDVLGVVEMENLTTLQALAARISADAIAAAQPDPEYDAYLVEGNDIGGIDVGFLVKTAEVAPTIPRVEVVEVQQELDGTLFVNPDSSTETLNDRPPLRLNAIIHHMNGASFPVTVIVNHLRSLNGVNDEAAGSNGWATGGARVRAKRQAQAEDLADLVQARQTADPTEHIVLVGDFNAFEVNDGLGHSMAVIGGTPVPDNETAVPGDGVDLVNPDLDNLDDTPPAPERYSYIFDGNAQTLDHVLINQPLIADTTAQRIEHPRINADFPQTARNDGTSPVRLSDHDPVVAYFLVPGFASAGVSITKLESADPVTAGTSFSYTVTVANSGPDPADNVSWSDTLPAGTTFVSLSNPGGWSCTIPAVGSGGTVSCSIASLGVGNAAFTLTVQVDPSVAAGSILSNTANATTTTTDDPIDNSATETTTVAASADLSITKVSSSGPTVAAGSTITYGISVSNAGPSNAATVTVSDTLPAGTTFQSLSAPAGWSCTTPAVGLSGTVFCSIASLPPSTPSFTLIVGTGSTIPHGAVISNTATISSATGDPAPGDESSTANVQMRNLLGSLSLTKSDTPDPVAPGGNITYTITASNNGVESIDSVGVAELMPAGTTFVSLNAPAGWSCNPPPVGGNSNFECLTAAWAPGSAVFTLVLQVSPSRPPGTTITNEAHLGATDGGDTVEAIIAMITTQVLSPAAVSGTKSASGSFTPGSTVTYTVVLSNAGPAAQADNPGNEFTDVLPAGLTLVSATATSGTAVATVGTNTVTWNGSIPASGSVTITITATINAGLAPGTAISNQGNFSSDADGNGTNEASGVTDNPATAGPDATSFVVAPGAVAGPANIPTLDEIGLALLVLLLAMGGAVTLRRRRT